MQLTYAHTYINIKLDVVAQCIHKWTSGGRILIETQNCMLERQRLSVCLQMCACVAGWLWGHQTQGFIHCLMNVTFSWYLHAMCRCFCMKNAKLRLNKSWQLHTMIHALVQVGHTGLDVCPRELNVRELINRYKLTCETFKTTKTDCNIQSLRIPERSRFVQVSITLKTGCRLPRWPSVTFYWPAVHLSCDEGRLQLTHLPGNWELLGFTPCRYASAGAADTWWDCRGVWGVDSCRITSDPESNGITCLMDMSRSPFDWQAAE